MARWTRGVTWPGRSRAGDQANVPDAKTQAPTGPGTATSPGGAGRVHVGVRGVGEQDPLVVLGERGAREVAVGLARHQVLDLVALVRSGGLPEPVTGVADDHRVGFGDAAGVLDAEQLLLGAVDLPPQRGPAGALAFAAGQQAVGDTGGGRGQLHLPVHGVGGEEDQGRAPVAGQFRGAAHGGGPVLVVAGEDQAPVAGRVDPAGVQVAGVGVGEVVAVALGEADEVVGVAHVEGQPGAAYGRSKETVVAASASPRSRPSSSQAW